MTVKYILLIGLKYVHKTLMRMTYFLIHRRDIFPLSDGPVPFQVLSDCTCSSNQFKRTETTEHHGCPLVHALLAYLFVCLTIWKAGAEIWEND